MLARVRAPRRLEGEVRVPGDKSISHRALILNAVAEGEARLRGLSSGADVASTAACLRQLGVEVKVDRVVGRGLKGLRRPALPLDCGNSGTTMRLLAGLLAAAPFVTTLVGDASLSSRPMERVAGPLRQMGASAETGPLRVGGRLPLRALDHRLPVASAQVKSALLLAGLYANGTTRVTEPAPTRDHTERMLREMGAPVSFGDCSASVVGPVPALRALDVDVPGDPSAAVFWIVACGFRGGRLHLPSVGANPTRIAGVDLLIRLGLRAEWSSVRPAGAELVGDLEVSGLRSRLGGLAVSGADTAALIDELPVLAVAATQLAGASRIAGASELRVKESDRIATMAEGLRRMGADVSELSDGWEIRGPSRLRGARLDSRGDHRVAMALAVAALLAAGETEIDGAECVAISYPGFWDQLEALCSS